MKNGWQQQQIFEVECFIRQRADAIDFSDRFSPPVLLFLSNMEEQAIGRTYIKARVEPFAQVLWYSDGSEAHRTSNPKQNTRREREAA